MRENMGLSRAAPATALISWVDQTRLTRSSSFVISATEACGAARAHKRARSIDGHHRAEKPVNGGFDLLPDDLLLSIFISMSSRAESPRDLINPMLTCRRFFQVARNPLVLGSASAGAMRVKASQWCDGALSFLAKSTDAANLEACFTLGMIKFYCLMDRQGGVELIAKAAEGSHTGALHALAVIQFNGSGGGRTDKNLNAGVRLCARAASLGHVDAMRELGHCLQDGYGVPKNVLNGRRLILEANVREAARCESGWFRDKEKGLIINNMVHCCALLSDFGCSVPTPAPAHAAHEFLLDWFHTHSPLLPGLRLCAHAHCGRPETRKHEFRRCSACGLVNYCSRACQALDWKLRHKLHCLTSLPH